MPCEIVSQPLNCTTAARWELIALLSQDLESALFCCQVPERLTHGGLSGYVIPFTVTIHRMTACSHSIFLNLYKLPVNHVSLLGTAVVLDSTAAANCSPLTSSLQ